ncbi:hypothetical protein ACFYUD_36015 [Nocardia tengchongensis]|uniref:hypothetical protein n=1 Tax=Nocardia tengchongensis TaxID=2055889 RepID=UPI003687C41D
MAATLRRAAALTEPPARRPGIEYIVLSLLNDVSSPGRQARNDLGSGVVQIDDEVHGQIFS